MQLFEINVGLIRASNTLCDNEDERMPTQVKKQANKQKIKEITSSIPEITKSLFNFARLASECFGCRFYATTREQKP